MDTMVFTIDTKDTIDAESLLFPLFFSQSRRDAKTQRIHETNVSIVVKKRIATTSLLLFLR